MKNIEVDITNQSVAHQLRAQGPDPHYPAPGGPLLDQQLRGPGPGATSSSRTSWPAEWAGAEAVRRLNEHHPQQQALPTVDGHHGVRRLLPLFSSASSVGDSEHPPWLSSPTCLSTSGPAIGQVAHAGLLRHHGLLLPGHVHRAHAATGPVRTSPPSIVVAGGILLLLPTGRLVSSVQDAINGFPVTAAGRFLSTILTFGAIVAGHRCRGGGG